MLKVSWGHLQSAHWKCRGSSDSLPQTLLLTAVKTHPLSRPQCLTQMGPPGPACMQSVSLPQTPAVRVILRPREEPQQQWPGRSLLCSLTFMGAAFHAGQDPACPFLRRGFPSQLHVFLQPNTARAVPAAWSSARLLLHRQMIPCRYPLVEEAFQLSPGHRVPT